MRSTWLQWSLLWGGLDLLYFAFYAIASLIKGHIPLYYEFEVAQQTTVAYGNSFPLSLVIAGVVFYISLPVSGWLLVNKSRWGRYLSYAQVLPRAFLLIPSFFPLIYLFRYLGVWLALALLLLCELVKALSIRGRGSEVISF